MAAIFLSNESDAGAASLHAPDMPAIGPIEPEPIPLAPMHPDSGDAIETHITNVIEFPATPSSEQVVTDGLKRIGHLEISLPLFNIFIAQADDLLRYLSHEFF